MLPPTVNIQILSLLLVYVVYAHYFGCVQSAAIPMWEYLQRHEKIEYLKATLTRQVHAYCTNHSSSGHAHNAQQQLVVAPPNNCQQELLRYGLNNLRRMSERHLDELDPYQRDSSAIIWASIMGGHIKGPPTATTTTTAPSSLPPNYYQQKIDYSAPSGWYWQPPKDGGPSTRFLVIVYPNGLPVIQKSTAGWQHPDEDLRQYQLTQPNAPLTDQF